MKYNKPYHLIYHVKFAVAFQFHPFFVWISEVESEVGLTLWCYNSFSVAETFKANQKILELSGDWNKDQCAVGQGIVNDRPGECSSENWGVLLVTDVSTTWAKVIFRK